MRDYTSEDKAMRKRLESQSHAGTRADVAGILNKVAAGDVAQGRAGISSYVLAMLANQGHDRHVRQLNKAHDRGGFDRLHPDSRMRRRVPASPMSDIPANERDDARNDRIGPELRAECVSDTGGMDADRQTRSDFLPGRDVITLEAMRAMAMAASLRRFF